MVDMQKLICSGVARKQTAKGHLKIALIFLVLFFSSCSEYYKRKIIENNKEVDYALYDMVLVDSNFFFYDENERLLGIKYFVDRTRPWNTKRFHFTLQERIKMYLIDEGERSDSNTTYLFSDTENLISAYEKKALAEYAKKIAPEPINHNFANLKPVSINDSFKGMCVELTKPIYSASGNLAFLDIYLHKNLSKTYIDTTAYDQKIGFILSKDENGNWKTLKKKRWILL